MRLAAVAGVRRAAVPQAVVWVGGPVALAQAVVVIGADATAVNLALSHNRLSWGWWRGQVAGRKEGTRKSGD